MANCFLQMIFAIFSNKDKRKISIAPFCLCLFIPLNNLALCAQILMDWNRKSNPNPNPNQQIPPPFALIPECRFQKYIPVYREEV